MQTLMQIFVGLSCLPLTALALRAMFRPVGMGEAMSITPAGAAGLNTIRSVIGGLFVACVSMLVLGLVTGQTLFFLAVALVMGAVALGRVVGIFADGLDRAVLPPLAVEIVIGSVLVAAHLAGA